MTIGGLILAAGASTRMGSPKQLVDWRGRTLLDHAIETLLATKCRPVAVVLGANAQSIQPRIEHHPVTVLHNPDWQQGMGSTIRTGIEGLRTLQSDLDGVLIMLCDQPLIRSADLESLCCLFQSSGKSIAAARYKGRLGVPAVFARRLWTELTELNGEGGAKRVIAGHAADAVGMDLAAAETDLDTRDDVERVREKDEGRSVR